MNRAGIVVVEGRPAPILPPVLQRIGVDGLILREAGGRGGAEEQEREVVSGLQSALGHAYS